MKQCCETFPGFDDSDRNLSVGWNFTAGVSSEFGSSVFNDFRLGINQTDTSSNGVGEKGVSTRAADAAITAINGAGSAASNPMRVNRQYINFTPAGISPVQISNATVTLEGTKSISNFVTVLSGNHQYKFGVEARFVKSTGTFNFGRQEELSFNLPTSFGETVLTDDEGNDLPIEGISGTVQDFASYLYGLVERQEQSQYFDAAGNRKVDDVKDFRQKEFDFFFQDQWKIRPNLTFTYGIRYEYKGVPYEVNGLLSTLVDQDPSLPTPEGGFEFKILRKGDLLYNNDYNNWAPRIGFAYSPSFKGGFLKGLFGETGDTSIRGNYGIYYDRVFGGLVSDVTGNAPFQRDFFESIFESSFIIEDALIRNTVRPSTEAPSRFVQEGTRARPVLFPLPGNNTFQDKFATPYTQSWNLSLQRQLFISQELSVLLEASYVGTKSLNQLRVVDGNRTSVNRANLLRGTNSRINPDSPFQNYENGSLSKAFLIPRLNLTVGNAIYHAGQFRVTSRFDSSKYGNGEFQAGYTWSRSIDDAVDPFAESSLPRDSSGFVGGLKAERGDSAFDARHNFVFNGTYELPFESTNSFVNHLISGFTISGIFSYVSGKPYSVFASADSAGTGVVQRADFVGAGNGLRQISRVDSRRQTGLTRDYFTNPTPNADDTTGRQGTSGRSAFRGPSFSSLDMSLIKRFNFGKDGHYEFSIRVDAFNLLNTVNFDIPVTNIDSANFGQSMSAVAARQFQFSGRFDF